MSLEISLDGVKLANTPKGWDKATIRSKRDKVINGLFTEYTTDLEFWGDGFTFINDVIDEGYCDVIDILIESDDCEAGVFTTEFEGVIPLTQITEMDVDEAIIKAKIVDVGYTARISNNKKISAVVDTGKSKNGIDIAPVAFVNIDFYDPVDGFNVYSFANRNCYRVFDCFKFIVAHITDGIVGFESVLFGPGGEKENLFILTGFELRQGSGNGEAPSISFQEMFEELSKKLNLGFAIVPSGSAGFNIKIEEDEFFRSEVASKTYRNVRGIKMKFNLERMYSNILVGSQTFELATSLSFPPVRLRGFREENFTIGGECNIENELNLISKWVIDSNAIEDVLTNGEDKHDDKIFLVETDGIRALKFDNFNEIRSSGQTTADTALKLRDAGANFVGDGVTVGDRAVNETTGLDAEVTAIDSAIQLSLDTDIFTANPEDYRIKIPPYTYNDGLSNYSSIINWLGNLPNSVLKFLGEGDDNFMASITSNIVYAAFPASTNPILYDDDINPPNFDTSNNYTPGTGQYVIPADGLYAFRAIYDMSFLGELGGDVVTNGDFSSGVGWIGATGGGATSLSGIDWVIDIGAQEAIIGTGRSSPAQVLYQTITMPANSRYILNFEMTNYLFGTLEVVTAISEIEARSGLGTIHQTFNASTTDIIGSHQVELNIVGQQNVLVFRAVKNDPSSGQVNLGIGSVTLQPMPKFTMTTRIIRFNSNLQALDTFSLVTSFSIVLGIGGVRTIQNDTGAFSAFAGDIIRSSISVVDDIGAGTEVTLLAGSSFESTLVEDGGGELVGVDEEAFIAYKYEFEKALTILEFRNIVDNPEEAIVFNRGNDPNEDIIGWREIIEFDKSEGIAKFNLVSKQKILPCSTT